MKNYVKLQGVVTDFNNAPLEGAVVALKNTSFENLYETYTDKDGKYEIEVKKGLYYTFYACKDYRVNYLEYWAWNIPLYEDKVIDAKIDGLEIYGVNIFQVQGGYPALMIYFRPMSLTRGLKLETDGNLDSLEIIDISPELEKEDIEVYWDDRKMAIYEVNKVMEYGGKIKDLNQHIYSYLIQIELPIEYKEKLYKYNKIDIKLKDKETGERGEGTIFWKKEQAIQQVNEE